jgi:hypothetical protein
MAVYADTISLSVANFVGFVVDFPNVYLIRMRSLLLAASLSFECEVVINVTLKMVSNEKEGILKQK